MRQLLLFIIVAFLWQCGNSITPGPFNEAPVIIISVDTLRSDRLGTYGYQGIKTPHIDGFAEQSLVFEHAYSPCPLTLPAHATLFTGLLPPEHGIRDNSFYDLPQNLETLAQRLSTSGYATAGIVSSVILGQRTGIAKGFQAYNSDLRDASGQVFASRDGESSIKLALDWLSQQGENSKTFLFLHLFEPHTPYDAPDIFAGPGIHPYDAEVAYTDALLGTFFEGLKQQKRYQKSIILLVSDHGEGLGDHGEAEHGILLYREAIQVPFILKLPGEQAAGKRLNFPVMLADVKPTLEQLVGLEPRDVSGKPLFSKEVSWTERPIFSETRYPFNNYGYPAGRSVIRNTEHFIEYGNQELYDLVQDSAEQTNLLPGKAVDPAITGFLQAVGAGMESRGGEATDDLELLASLGYSAVQVAQAQNLDRPITELVAVVQSLDRISEESKQGKLPRAKAELASLLEKNPCLHQARLDMAKILQLEGDFVGLEALYEEALLCDARNLRFLMLTGELKIRLGKLEQAKKLAMQVWQIGTLEAKGEYAYFFLKNGHLPEALQFAKLLEGQDSDNPYAAFIFGGQAMAENSLTKALQHFQEAETGFRASQQNELLVESLYFQGDVLRRKADVEQALKVFENAIALHPNHAQSRVGKSLVLGELGRTRDAIVNMDQWVRNFPSRMSYSTAAKTMQAIGEQGAAEFFKSQSLKYP